MLGCSNTNACFICKRSDSRMRHLRNSSLLVFLFAAAALAQSWTPARTPDGQPDIQGMYTRSGVVGLEAKPPENPIDPSAKNSLSVSQRGDGLGPYPGIFGAGGTVIRKGQARPP